MKNTIKYIQGLNGDRIEINGVTYAYGYTCSHTRAFARIAKKEHEDAIKYEWQYPHPLKPFIGDILEEVCSNWRTIEWTGVNVFAGRALTSEEIDKIKRGIEEEFKYE